jgi:hypothetical protein
MPKPFLPRAYIAANIHVDLPGLHELVLHNGCCSIRFFSYIKNQSQLLGYQATFSNILPSETSVSAWIQALFSLLPSLFLLIYHQQIKVRIALKKYRALAITAGIAGSAPTSFQ